MRRKNIDDTYLFGKGMQYVYKWVIPIIGYMVCALSLLFLEPPIYSQADWGPHIVSTASIMVIGMFLILRSKKIHKIANVQYTLTEDTASNHGKNPLSVSTQQPFYTCVFPIELGLRGGGVIPCPVYLLSNKPITYIPDHSTKALLLLKRVMDLGIVVLPVNDKTTAWMQQAIGTTPPEYPKIAYYQK